jgi:CubicO group peptidase (beta-lactamase class C family)
MATPTDAAAPPRRRWLRRLLVAVLVVVLLVVAVVVAVVLWFNVPSNAAGMAAKSVCSAAFVAGRGTDAKTLMQQDVLPASPALALVSTQVDAQQASVTAEFLGLFDRRASLQSGRGCVLDTEPDPQAQPFVAPQPDPRAWPAGDAAATPAQWPDGVDAAALQQVVDDAFAGSGDPLAANTRGVAVVQDGRLLVVRDGSDIAPGTPLHGWSMTKTVAGMLAYATLQERGIDLQTPVVEVFPADREPAWVAQWREDDRAEITVADLLFMRPGLAVSEGYQPWEPVVQMLYGEPDMAGWAADHPTDQAPGTYWEYLSATSNILADVVKAQFPSDEKYWEFSRRALFDPVGVTSATLETDTTGTWVGSSYLWASVTDWARLGQLMLDDGRWGGREVLPPGWLALASTRAMPDGEGSGYGAQTWIPGDPVGGECRDTPGVPADTLSMEGHWGQVVAMIPSKDAVIVRLGWTFEPDQFDACQFISDVAATLPAAG